MVRRRGTGTGVRGGAPAGPTGAAGRSGRRGQRTEGDARGRRWRRAGGRSKGEGGRAPGGDRAGERGGDGKQDFLQELAALFPFSVLAASSGSSAGEREKVTNDGRMSTEHSVAVRSVNGRSEDRWLRGTVWSGK